MWQRVRWMSCRPLKWSRNAQSTNYILPHQALTTRLISSPIAQKYFTPHSHFPTEHQSAISSIHPATTMIVYQYTNPTYPDLHIFMYICMYSPHARFSCNYWNHSCSLTQEWGLQWARLTKHLVSGRVKNDYPWSSLYSLVIISLIAKGTSK